MVVEVEMVVVRLRCSGGGWKERGSSAISDLGRLCAHRRPCSNVNLRQPSDNEVTPMGLWTRHQWFFIHTPTLPMQSGLYSAINLIT
jgi:hypothetical protein